MVRGRVRISGLCNSFTKMHVYVLELYSGIGGMHYAWNETGHNGKIVAAIDVNTVANSVYIHNLPDSKVCCRNIQSLSSAEITSMAVDFILMSPPCQPFSRNGNYLDTDDPRTKSFLHLLQVLKSAPTVKYILMENVKGFELSETRNKFMSTMQECGFETQEFLLNPIDMGIPNSRLRYYCIAKRKPCKWSFERKDEIIYKLENLQRQPYNLECLMQSNTNEDYYLQDRHLKGGNALDICYPSSTRSCCFTKSYTHYINGSGSVYTTEAEDTVKKTFRKANEFEVGSKQYIEVLKPLKLRFFTPKEVARVMNFPEDFDFPDTITMKQCYRLLGNSINVKVVSELIKITLK